MITIPMRRARVLLALITIVLVVAACGGDDEPAIDGPVVEFFDGIIPESLPDDFPIPAEAAPGASLINRGVDPPFTELTLRVPAPLPSVLAYFEANLPLRGYEIDGTTNRLNRIELMFSGASGGGSLFLEEEVSIQVTTVVLKIIAPG